MKSFIFYSLVFSFLIFNLANAENVFNQEEENYAVDPSLEVDLIAELFFDPKNKSGDTAWMSALKNGHTEVALGLIDDYLLDVKPHLEVDFRYR